MGTRFELTAAAAEDAHLAEHLRAETPESRRALLLEADRLRTGAETQRRLALVVYQALQDDLDPADPADGPRVGWMLENMQALHPGAEPLIARTAERCADKGARLRATVLAARYAERDGDLDRAERLIGGVIDAVRGTRSPIEFVALLHGARISADHEDCARALAFAARALGLRRSGIPATWVALARRCRGDAFGAMRDAIRCEREMQVAESVLPHLAPHEATALRAEIAASRGAALLRRGLAERALPWLDQALDGDDQDAPGRLRQVHVLRARAMLDLGRVDGAARHVARALRSQLRDCLTEYELELVQIRLQRTAGGTASARPRATELVDRLATSGRRVVGPGRRARLAMDLAKILAETGGDLVAARRAFDLAATSLVEAISRVDRDAAGLPELESLDADDLVALREHREREVAAHSEVEKSVARFFEDAARREGPAFLSRLMEDDGRLTACAWCGRIRGTDGRWLPIGHYLPSEEILDLTHAACEMCTGALVREMTAASQPR